MPLKNRLVRNIQNVGDIAESAAQEPFIVRLMSRTRLLPYMSAACPQMRPPINIPAKRAPASVDSSCRDNL